MNTITLNLPYQKRHLVEEIKKRGGKFNRDVKTWSLPDTVENRALTDVIQRQISGPTPAERIANVAQTCAELLNAIGLRHYRVIEAGDRIVLESESVTDALSNSQNEGRL
jgi:hypothetical protein